MRIISWNVNGIRAVERKGALEQFLEDHKPDIWLIQETKAQIEKIPKTLQNPTGYRTYYNAAEKPGYSGTGIWICEEFVKASNLQNLCFSTGMPNNPVSDEGRITQLDFEIQNQKYTVLGVYFPNGGKSDVAWQQKLVFYEAFLAHVNTLHRKGRIVVWGGDVNCAHNEIDLARAKENDGVIGFHPDERAWLDAWQAAGWTDLWRYQEPQTCDVYSWWHLISRARSRNVGWRIDYLYAHEGHLARLKRINYLTDQMGSDHCPVQLDWQV